MSPVRQIMYHTASVLFTTLLVLISCYLIENIMCGEDEGPTHPDFLANDGDLENDVNPLKAPKGNYNIVKDGEVYVLNRDTFAYFIMPRPLVLVEFYAPWCGHCKSLEPVYRKAARELNETGIPLAKVDATIESELAKEYFVQGFPTLLLFRNGVKIEEYTGQRTANGIIEYMQRNNDPDWKPPPTAVVELVNDNFTKFIKNKPLTLVMFYAPWCKHCKQVQPEFEGAASELAEFGIPLVRVDGTREKSLADKYSVAGWPTFKMFRKTRMYEYNGPREKKNIIDFMKGQASSPSEEKNNFLGLKNGMDRLDATIIGFFKDTSGVYEEYIVAANQMRNTFKFMHTFDADVTSKFGFGQESIVVFQPEIFWTPYENKTYILNKKSATYKEIISFIMKRSVPLVGQRSKKNEFKYASRPLLVVYYDVNYEYQYISDTQFIRNKIVETAKHYIGSPLTFAISNEDEYESEIKSLGLEDSGEDVSVGCFTEKQKFRMNYTTEFEASTLNQFIMELRDGKKKPYMKSLPIPKKQGDVVKNIVADNYDAEIHRVKKDAVIFFMAPWCGHCKEFDGVYKKVAKRILKNNPNIVFGKMDATVNDIPYMFPPITAYPTVFILSAYEKFDPIMFQGQRDYKTLKDWINRHSSIFLTEEEKTGQAMIDDNEIASFTNEKFDTETETAAMPKEVKDEL